VKTRAEPLRVPEKAPHPTLGFTPNPFRVTPKGKGVRAEWAPALWALALTPLG